jgi:histidine triad (HIT) family protein
MLVMPKNHYKLITDVPKKELENVMKVVKKLSSVTLKEAEGFNVLQNNKKAAGQIIDHVHFHIIPRYSNDGLKISYWGGYKYKEGEIEKKAKQIKEDLKNLK